MKSGCKFCGHHLFKTVGVSQNNSNTAISKAGTASTSSSAEFIANIGIKVQEAGMYQINILALASRKTKHEPIFVEDETGKINVVL